MTANNIQFTKIEIQIAKYLFKHCKDKHNARQLARALNLNHAHVNKLCKSLADKKLLIKEEIGYSTYFSYDYKNEPATKFMEYILSQEEKDFPKWLSVLFHSLNKFKPYIYLGFVFGSSIKSKTFNDIDIFLMYKKEKSEEVNKIKDEIRKSQQLQQPIRYLDITEKDILKNIKDKVFYNILSDNLIFHGSEKYAGVIKKCHR